ncbi:hypothetical protein F2Q68_00005355 [Brassica cretica]|uniref:Uncharacterized protein n=1 Tax=Brassica cretica TaxID=69181 RepID=A0A8S9JBT4_BRACR|nr:hypothetical protein F2Q68_00005355 [Brassica cretica]
MGPQNPEDWSRPRSAARDRSKKEESSSRGTHPNSETEPTGYITKHPLSLIVPSCRSSVQHGNSILASFRVAEYEISTELRAQKGLKVKNPQVPKNPQIPKNDLRVQRLQVLSKTAGSRSHGFPRNNLWVLNPSVLQAILGSKA